MNIPRVTLFKTCSQNFDRSNNVAQMNRGYFHSTDKEILKNSSSLKPPKEYKSMVLSKNAGERSRAIVALLFPLYPPGDLVNLP